MTARSVAFLTFVALVSVMQASGQMFDVSWHSIDGGGAMFSTGDGFELGGSMGQPDAGTMIGGGFELIGGFWAAALCPADLNEDRVIGLADLAQLLAHFGTGTGASSHDGDLDGDGDVDLGDLAALLASFGTVCP